MAESQHTQTFPLEHYNLSLFFHCQNRNDGSQRELEYGTEADVAGFVGDALFDAIGIAEVLVRGSKTERECGLFSGKPDILI